MDISRLPVTLLLKIFEYFPLEDRIRLGRVNKRFHRISQLSISRTKSLDLDEVRFRNLNSDQLANILDLCYSKLERFKVGGDRENHWTYLDDRSAILDNHDRQLATTLANYQCPRLMEIRLGHTPIDYAVFAQLIQNNQNVETLIWKREFVGYPPKIIGNNLKKLNLYVDNDDALRSLIGQFPNLKELDLRMGPDILTADILDQFFASIPQVNQVNLDIFSDFAHEFREIFRNELVNFCNLPLISLSIRLPSIHGDGIPHKLATSFKHLQKLHLDKLVPTNAGIAALAALQDLEILEFNVEFYGESFDEGYRQLADCTKLQKLSLYKSDMNGETLVHLFASCPKLEYVAIWKITEVANSEEAAVVLESLAGIAQRRITIEFCERENPAVKRIWDGEPVKEAIQKVEENDGLKIKILFVPWKGASRDERRWF